MSAWKRICAALCCLSAALGVFGLPAAAGEGPVGLSGAAAYGLSADEPKTRILEVQVGEPSILLFLPQGGDVSTLALPTNDISVRYNRFNWLFSLTAEWDFDSFDASVTGMQTLKGTVELPDGYAYYDADGKEAPLVVEQPVWVHHPDMEETEEVRTAGYVLDKNGNPYFPPFPLGTDAADIGGQIERYRKDTLPMVLANRFNAGLSGQMSSDYFFSSTFRYALDRIDTSRAGKYYPFVIDTPPGITIAEQDLCDQPMSVVVLDPDKVDLNGMFVDYSMPYRIYGDWLYAAEHPQLWVSETSPLGEGAQPEWHPLEAERGRPRIDLNGTSIETQVNSTRLLIEFFSPPDGSEYWFQVRYDGGESNYLRVVIDSESMIGLETGGDRIGDTGGNQNPPKTPEPQPPGVDEPEEPGNPDPTNPETPGPTEPSEPQNPGPTEPQQPGPTEPQGPGPTEPQGPGPTEPQGPGPTEPQEPGPTEPQQPRPTEPQQPGPTEPQEPGPTEPQQPRPTEPGTPASPTPGPIYPGGPASGGGDSSRPAQGSDIPDGNINSGTNKPPRISPVAEAIPLAAELPDDTGTPVPPEPPPASTAVTEASDPAALEGVALTGAELRALMARKPELVPFRHDEVEVWIPTEALAALSIGDADVFAVRVDYRPGESLEILITVNNMEISLQSGFTAAIPWAEGAELPVDADGNPLSCTYDRESGTLRIVFPEPGTVCFPAPEPEDKPPATVNQSPSMEQGGLPGNEDAGGFPVAVGILGIAGVSGAGGSAWWLRKRRGKG